MPVLFSTSLDLQKYRPRIKYRGQHVVVAGLFASASGIGKAAELVARTLERQGAFVTRVDITAEMGLAPSFESEVKAQPADCTAIDATDVVVVLNPTFLRALKFFDQGWLLGRCIIAHWIWEIETIPDFWKGDAVSYDEIWAPTEFVEQSIRELLPNFDGAIRTVPYAIDFQLIDTPKPRERADVRNRLMIDPSSFVIGYSFACGSNYQRKNPEAAIDQFRTTFPDNDRTTILILRCRDLNHHKAESVELRKKIAGDKRILLFDDKTSISIRDFYAAIDVYLSPSRVEGFGLNLVEASQMGIPVITSGWRLPSQIASLPYIHSVDYDLIPIVDPQGQYSGVKGGRWSEPRLATVVSKLRLLRGEHRDAHRRVEAE